MTADTAAEAPGRHVMSGCRGEAGFLRVTVPSSIRRAALVDARVAMKEFLIRLGLVALSVVVAVGAVEIVLRLTYDVDDLYAVFQLKPEIADVGWQRTFVRDYGRVRGSNALINDLTGYVHDSELGWDVPGRFRTGAPDLVEKPNGAFRVLAIGDSYTYGAQVEADQTYAAYLERLLPSSQVLNMGVRAYGIDQAVLKYLRHGRAYRADLIVFGVFGPDYTRTPLSFFRFAKPLFQLGANGELVLTRTPVPTPEEMYRRLTAELPPLSYLETLARVAYQTRFADDEREAYYNKWDPLIERLFAELLHAAKEDGSRVLFLYIPTGRQLANAALAENHCCDRKHLANIWKRLARTASFDVIDLTEALPREYGRDRVMRDMQIHFRGRPQGHFTPRGNEAVAEIIARFLQNQHSGIGAAPTGDANRKQR
jgi:hypothetical protein